MGCAKEVVGKVEGTTAEPEPTSGAEGKRKQSQPTLCSYSALSCITSLLLLHHCIE